MRQFGGSDKALGVGVFELIEIKDFHGIAVVRGGIVAVENDVRVVVGGRPDGALAITHVVRDVDIKLLPVGERLTGFRF